MLYTIFACIVLWIVLFAIGTLTANRRSSLRAVSQDIFLFPNSGFIIVCTGLCLAAAGLSLPCCELFVPRVVVTETFELAAMRTTNGAGSFVFGNGSIDSVVKYSVYIKKDNGGVSPRTIWSDDNVVIREMPDLKNVGYWKRSSTKFDYSSAWAHWVIHRPGFETLVTNELDVPVGTVVHNFAAQ